MTKKIYQGPIKNRERTKQKFLDAVGEIITTEGYTGLGVNKIARQAGMNKSLIYSYFGGVNNLIQQHARSNDFWLLSNQNTHRFIEESQIEKTELIKTLLLNQLEFFSSNKQMQKFIIWQISERSQIMNEIAIAREKITTEYFKFTDDPLSKKADFRAVSAIFISAIYYLTLFSKNNTSTFCDIDFTKKSGLDRIINSMSHILELLQNSETTQPIDDKKRK